MIVMVFAATDAELAVLQRSQVFDPTQYELPTVEVDVRNPMDLVSFDAALTGEDEEEIQSDVLSEPIAIVDGGEQLVFAIRPAVIDVLRGEPGAARNEVAARWAATGGRGEILADLVALVRQAGDQRRLFCWLSV